MTKTRALRRWHRIVKIKTALSIIKQRMYTNDPKRDLHDEAARHVDHLTKCSCYMCGNQRHNDWQSNKEQLTMQERRNNEKFKEWENQT